MITDGNPNPSYELALELKNAGFPTPEIGCGHCEYFQWYDEDGNQWDSKEVGNEEKWNDKNTYIPTLSELIEACGDEFWQLQRSGELALGVRWRAYQYKQVEGAFVSYVGSTPEEAVSRLWLALNKK